MSKYLNVQDPVKRLESLRAESKNCYGFIEASILIHFCIILNNLPNRSSFEFKIVNVVIIRLL